MKLFTRTCLIFSGIIISIGLILAILGGALGAGNTFAAMVQNGRFSWGWSENQMANQSKELVNFDSGFEGVESIAVDLKYTELVFEATKEDVYYVQADRVVKGFTCEEKDGRLIIKDNLSRNFRNNRSKVTVFIPENAKLKEVELEVGAGSVNVDDILADKLTIDLGAGRFEGNKITSDKAEISVGAGEMTVNNFSTKDVTMDCGAGRIDLKGNIDGDADISCGIGEIKVSLLNGESDYNYDIDCGIGNVNVGNQSFGGMSNNKKIDNNADKTIRVEGGVGNIRIDFINSL